MLALSAAKGGFQGRNKFGGSTAPLYCNEGTTPNKLARQGISWTSKRREEQPTALARLQHQ